MKDRLKGFDIDEMQPELQRDPNVFLTLAAKKVFMDLDGKGESFPPYEFV